MTDYHHDLSGLRASGQLDESSFAQGLAFSGTAEARFREQFPTTVHGKIPKSARDGRLDTV